MTIDLIINELTALDFKVNIHSFLIWTSVTAGVLYFLKPTCMFLPNGAPKGVGTSGESETVFPWWLASIGSGYITQRII